MTRYLTPAKIGLLALIELYTENSVPTASTIPVLSFIISKILPSSLPKPQNVLPHDKTKFNEPEFIITPQDFEDLLSRHPSAHGIPGRTLWDLIVSKLWHINSLDALQVFIDDKCRLLAKTKEELKRDEELGVPPTPPEVIILSRTSPFGVFVRRAQLELLRMDFEGTTRLWKSFLSWRKYTATTWARRNSAFAENGDWTAMDSVLMENPGWAEGELATVVYGDILNDQEYDVEGLVSTDDIEKLLEFQVEQMQKLGNRVSEEVKDQFRRIASGNVTIPSLSHYVSFLDAWRAGDYPTSFDNLHRFFDYTMQNRDRLFYQYALLNLAVLQADFGCYHEAVAAMQETVSTARENKDMGCLNFSLSWLYHFGKTHPDVISQVSATNGNMLGVDRSGLAFLRVKAKESGMWSLLSSSLLSEAKMGLSNGESVALAFENILRSSHLTITKNLLSSIGCQLLLQSSLWSRLGVTHLANAYTQLFLRAHSRFAPFDDVLKFTCRLAHLLTLKGKYHLAMEKIDSLDPNSLKTLKANQYYLRFRGILKLKRDLHHNNLDGADQLLSQLLQGKSGDPDLRFELNILHVNALMRRQDHNAALEKVEQLFKEVKEAEEDVYYRVKLLIMKAQLYDRCGRTQKGFSVAVRAASTAWKARLMPALWQAMGAIANILISLDEFEAAKQILSSVIPRALECEDCAINAQLYSFLVDAEMGMAGKYQQSIKAAVAASRLRSPDKRSSAKGKGAEHSCKGKQMEHFTRALEFIERAFTEFSSLEDIEGQCEMMAKKGVVLRLLGEEALAADCAMKYLDLRRKSKAGMA